MKTTALLSALEGGKCLFLKTWGKLDITPKSRPPASYRSSLETPSSLHISQQAGQGEGWRNGGGEYCLEKKEPALDRERSELEP